MIKKVNTFLILIALVAFASSCSVNKDIMFKTETDYVFSDYTVNDSIQYKISANDRLRFSLYTNDGFILVDQTGGDDNTSSEMVFRESVISYLVGLDGMVKLPTLGMVKLEGLNIKEAEDFLEKKYSAVYINPFVTLRVLNKRAIVSTGSGGSAKVITLDNNNTTLIEVLALAGGIAERGDASKIKVIRDKGHEKEIYNIDLSTIDGVKMGDMIIQANDVVYVTPVPRVASELLQQIVPVVALLTSTFALIAITASK